MLLLQSACQGFISLIYMDLLKPAMSASHQIRASTAIPVQPGCIHANQGSILSDAGVRSFPLKRSGAEHGKTQARP